jgi:tetratricopeptide (TPR) repeat protein
MMRVTARRIARSATGLLCAAALVGCVAPSGVERVYDGNLVVGRFVSAEAYAAFLRGALAEADGQTEQAMDAYEESLARQPWSPEVWSRVGDLRCRASPSDPRADDAFERALRLDTSYAPAWTARAACAQSRGDVSHARFYAQQAAGLDPSADDAQVLLARIGTPLDPSSRLRLIALTATARDPVVAWEALSHWAEGAGDVALWAQALRELAHRVPARRRSIAGAAEALAGAGALGDARLVAASVVDAIDEPFSEGHALAARLAIDEAIARHDGAAVRARATRTRISLEEAAGRALLTGDSRLARELALEVSRADPDARGARLVLIAATGGDLRELTDLPLSASPVSAAALVAAGIALTRATPSVNARVALAPMRTAMDPIAPGDDVVARPAVELVSRGVLDPSALPSDAAVELAAVRGEPAVLSRGFDLRHEYLALSMQRSDAPRAHELARRLAGMVQTDPIVASAAALAQLSSGVSIPPEAPRVLLARNPFDPLLAATALRLAERVGDHEVATRARRTLTALSGAGAAKNE